MLERKAFKLSVKRGVGHNKGELNLKFIVKGININSRVTNSPFCIVLSILISI